MNGESDADARGSFGLESRLRRALSDRAESAQVGEANWGDLAGRIAWATRRRQRILAAATGLALLVGAAGGFLGEAAAAGNGAGSSASRAPSAVPGPRSESGKQSPTSSGPSGPIGSGAPCIAAPNGSAGPGVGTSTHVLSRTTADGVTVRVYRYPSPAFGCGSTVVPGCFGSTSIELSDDTAVGLGTLGPPPGIYQGPVAPQTESTSAPGSSRAQGGSEPQAISDEAFGVVEGDPVWWIAVQVGGEVSSVRATFADGSRDQMAPIGGVAVVAHHVPGSVASADQGPDTVRATLELLGPGGGVLATVVLPQQPQPVPEPQPAPAPAPAPAPTSPPPAARGPTGPGSTSSGAVSGTIDSVPPATTTTTSGSTVVPPAGGGSSSSGGPSSGGGAVACPRLGAPTPG